MSNTRLISRDDIGDAEYIDEDGRKWGGANGPSDEEMAYAKFRSEMADHSQQPKLTVYAQPADSMGRNATRGQEFLFDCDLDEYEFTQLLARLRDQYGTGRYRLIARDGTGGFLFNRGVTIRAPKKPEESANAPQNPADMFEHFARIMEQQQARTEQLVQRLMAGQKSGGLFEGGGMEQFALMFGMIEKIASVFSGKAVQTDIVAEFQKLAALKETMAGLFDGGDGGAGKGLHDTLTETIRTLGPLFVEGARQQSQQAPRRDPARLQAPQPAPVQPARPQPQPQQNPSERQAMSEQEQELIAKVTLLVNLAAAKMDPENVADMILDQTADEALPALKEFVEAPDVLDRMMAVNPQVFQHTQWFTGLRDSLRDYFANEYANPPEENLQSENPPATLAPSDASAAPSGAATEETAERNHEARADASDP